MAKSTTLIADIGTVVTAGPSAATTAKNIAQAGAIQDYPGTTALAKLKLQEASVQLALVVSQTDSTDSVNLALLNGVQAALKGTSSPSTQLITDTTTVYTTGPNSASAAKAIAQAGPIGDYVGNVHGVRLKLREALVVLNRLIAGTDSADSTSLGHLNDCANALV